MTGHTSESTDLLARIDQGETVKVPPHWWINGPSKPRVASELFRFTHIAGGHAATYRRLFRIGPWSFAVIRYRPGDDPTVPTIPTSATPARVNRRPASR